MSDTAKTSRRRSNAEVPALLERLIDEVAQLRKEQGAFHAVLFGSEGSVGLAHDLRALKAEVVSSHAELRTAIEGCVKKADVEATARGAKWVWSAVTVAATVLSTLAGFVISYLLR